MPTLGRGDDARLLWYASQAMGTGASYNVVTITAIKDGGAWERLALRIQGGDLQGWMRDVDTLRHEVTGKILLPLYWSPLKEVNLREVPDGSVEHEPTLFMEDTGWPHAPLDDYIKGLEELYSADDPQCCEASGAGTPGDVPGCARHPSAARGNIPGRRSPAPKR